MMTKMMVIMVEDSDHLAVHEDHPLVAVALQQLGQHRLEAVLFGEELRFPLGRRVALVPGPAAG